MRRALSPWLTIAAVGLASFTFSLSTLSFLNDHFHRITSARQIARYGALPFKDFLDPGFFLTEMTSAGLQWLLGDNLLGEALLDVACIATGAALVAWVSYRVSRSHAMAVAAALLAVFAMPRAYDYDKVLFYPLGVLLCRRYVERDRALNLMLLAAGIGIAGLFRYDNGVLIGLAASVTLVALHAREPTLLWRRLGLFAVTLALTTVPVLLAVYGGTGTVDAARQALTYGMRERLRTRLARFPAVHTVRLVTVGVEETIGSDRNRYTVPSQGAFWTRLRRVVPRLRLRPLPDGWPRGNTIAVLYYLSLSLPIVALMTAFRVRRSGAVVNEEVGALHKRERAWVLGVAVLALLIVFFILRDPVEARIGGGIGPTAVLSAWMASRILSAKPTAFVVRLAVTTAVVVVIASEAVAADWSDVYSGATHIGDRLTSLAASPPRANSVLGPQVSRMVDYVRECTRPDDRLFVSLFAPELYFFAQRGFAGGMVVMFGDHWSEPWFQNRIVEKLEADRAPIIISEAGNSIHRSWKYSLVSEYIRTRYHEVGETRFGYSDADSQLFTVLARNDRQPVSIDPDWSLPCFA